MATDAYVAHILRGLNGDLDFLIETGHLSVDDARVIRARLPASPSTNGLNRTPSHASTAPSLQSLSLSDAASGPPPIRHVPPPPARATSQRKRAEALWPYNSPTAGDLNFQKGEIIEIVEMPNEHWYKGALNGREGIFPSNHVRILAAPDEMAPYAQPPPSYGYDNKMMAPQQQPYMAPPPPQQPPQQQVAEAPQPAKKPSRFGGSGLGNTLAHAGVGGLGFGAGSAAASELVHAIF